MMPDGAVKYVRVLAHRTPGEEPGGLFFVGAVTDVTELKHAEQQREKLRQLEAEIARFNRVSMMSELAASLAHEIKQPVAGFAADARAVLNWLRRETPEIEEACESASCIINGADRIAQIVDRNRALYGRERTQRELIDLNEIVREMVVLLRDTARRNSISIRSELDPALPATSADRVQLQQILMNLMLNGIEAMKEESGELNVTSMRTRDGELLVAVSDSGIGLPEAGPERIFDAFFTTKPEGTGMGLAISRRIIESHGGHLWARANAGRGATFKFTLPMQPSASLRAEALTPQRSIARWWYGIALSSHCAERWLTSRSKKVSAFVSIQFLGQYQPPPERRYGTRRCVSRET
jgi:signal transduction histidine kinase